MIPLHGAPGSFSSHHLKVLSFPHGVHHIVLTRGDIHNAFHGSLIADFISALEFLKQNLTPETLRILVLRGEGKSFCAGADLADMQAQSQASSTENQKHARRLAQLFLTLANFPVPVLALAHGAAIGGGLGLVACADIAIATESCIFATSEVRLGIVPAVISPYLLRKAPLGQASYFMLSGERFGTRQALEWGLVQGICADNALESKTKECVAAFLKAGPYATRMTKELILKNKPLPQENLVEATAQYIAAARSHPEGQAGLAAFFRKQPPPWCPAEAPL